MFNLPCNLEIMKNYHFNRQTLWKCYKLWTAYGSLCEHQLIVVEAKSFCNNIVLYYTEIRKILLYILRVNGNTPSVFPSHIFHCLLNIAKTMKDAYKILELWLISHSQLRKMKDKTQINSCTSHGPCLTNLTYKSVWGCVCWVFAWVSPQLLNKIYASASMHAMKNNY